MCLECNVSGDVFNTAAVFFTSMLLRRTAATQIGAVIQNDIRRLNGHDRPIGETTTRSIPGWKAATLFQLPNRSHIFHNSHEHVHGMMRETEVVYAVTKMMKICVNRLLLILIHVCVSDVFVRRTGTRILCLCRTS